LFYKGESKKKGEKKKNGKKKGMFFSFDEMA